MHVLMTPVGSGGDVNPFVTIGRALRGRGHDVTLVAPEPFASIAARADLRFVSVWSTEDFERTTGNPDLWHPQRGLRLVLRTAAAHLRAHYDVLEREFEPGRTLLVGHTLAFSTRVFEEVHRAPAVTVQLAPSAFRSDFRQPAVPPARDISHWPRWVKRALWWGLDRVLIDPAIVPVLNAWRAELGLLPVSRIFKAWVHSPHAVVGLFPGWFGDPQPDWPAQTHLTGFVLSHGSGDEIMDDHLRRFVEAGDPPIVFTPGTANRQAATFFAAAAEAAHRLGRRALFLTRYAEQLPSPLPDRIHHATWAPLTVMLPSCAALVHHGGIGTCAQGFAAGVPQLVMPMGFDQPDNALRVTRLGCGRWIAPNRFTGPAVAEALGTLLEHPGVTRACRRRRDAIAATDALGDVCDQLERAATSRWTAGAAVE